MTTLSSITSPFVIEDINLFLHPVTSLLSGPVLPLWSGCALAVNHSRVPQPNPSKGRLRPAHLRGAVRPPPASIRSRVNKGSAFQRIISSLNDRKQLIFPATQHQLPPRRAGTAASSRPLCPQLLLISRLAPVQACVPALAQVPIRTAGDFQLHGPKTRRRELARKPAQSCQVLPWAVPPSVSQ